MTCEVIDALTSRAARFSPTASTDRGGPDDRHPHRPVTDTQRGLRTVLRLDAVASGTLGIAAGAGAGVLDTLLGLPGGLLLGVGVFLVVYAVGLVVLVARPLIPRPATWVVVLGNSAWVLASLGLAVGAWEQLTVLGAVVVLAQAAAVAVFADLQYARR
ncbi:hypothetical protein ACQPX6_15575 [Actinomycetospora sp. CA-101289]|uniref:hypothetical protein n=1 Tax=Actinomycetospora sp. CA-101289 TaxID=3239893 RepID=UPI003D97BB10